MLLALQTSLILASLILMRPMFEADQLLLRWLDRRLLDRRDLPLWRWAILDMLIGSQSYLRITRFELPNDAVRFDGEELIKMKPLTNTDSIKNMILQQIMILHSRCASPLLGYLAKDGDIRNYRWEFDLTNCQMR
jgi:hypothetical protein